MVRQSTQGIALVLHKTYIAEQAATLLHLPHGDFIIDNPQDIVGGHWHAIEYHPQDQFCRIIGVRESPAVRGTTRGGVTILFRDRVCPLPQLFLAIRYLSKKVHRRRRGPAPTENYSIDSCARAFATTCSYFSFTASSFVQTT